MKSTRPYILLSNDDGVSAPGLNYLIDILRPVADLFVVAPDKPRSGFACSITSVLPITCKKLEEKDGLTIYECTGTPVDCVKLAISRLLPRRPDLVVGGVNHGSNASVNVHYSGTMGVAIEGTVQGIPSIAFSLCDWRDDADFTPLNDFVLKIINKVITEGLLPYTCLNINFPLVPSFKGVRLCRMAYSRWTNEFDLCPRLHGQNYFWLAGECTNAEPDADDTDSWALANGYIAITPTQIDVTAYALIEKMKNWDL